MIRNLIRQFAGGAAAGRRPARRSPTMHRYRGGSRGSGATGARIGGMVERFIRSRR